MRAMLPALAAIAALVAGCAGGPAPADWQLNSSQALTAFQRYYLKGDRRADAEFNFARHELASTGREDLVARAELVRCAVQVASLEFTECAGFEAVRAGVGTTERAYADYLAGKGSTHAASGDPLSRLVALGVRLRAAEIDPEGIAQAVDIAAEQGWRRPLLAWLAVQERRAREAGDHEAASAIRRRIELVSS
jgi:hypothetical protein